MVRRLHIPRTKPLPALVPLVKRFEALWSAAATHRGVFEQSAETARQLFRYREVTVLHGDIHHGNVLDFGPKGWLAIDPKGLYGERGFDLLEYFLQSGYQKRFGSRLFRRRIGVVAMLPKLIACRLLQWVLAWTGLSQQAWKLEDDIDPNGPLP